MTNNNNTTYRSLADLQARKDELLVDIRKDDAQIRSLWSQLFSRSKTNAPSTPSKRINSLLNTGAGVLDAVILGWKLYHKFGKKSFFGRRK